MVRLEQYDEHERAHLLGLPCPRFPDTPYVTGVNPQRARVAIVSTAGLHRRSDRPFGLGEAGYRVLPAEVDPADLLMSHVSTNFDRTGYQMDINLVLPLDRLRELAARGTIGSVADFHYSFMGATEPGPMEQPARSLAAILKGDRVDCILLVPV
ncbi:MAG: glycine/betaine/sarcosine/D-proline family reductase selenoprotein B [Desulfofustis sp.]|jgi:D-proline reductase (dithiol) PrdB|nr:glycine/betaine/sarcosine/D-proline family reductase selenoprotein B [Desulfofustis sp.]